MPQSDSNTANPPLARPLRARTATGAMRRVGVELEFTGLSIERIAARVRHVLGGRIEPRSAYEYAVRETRLGDFKVELDYAYLRQRAREDDGDGLRGDLSRLSEELLGVVARRLVPLEVIAPPVALDRLHLLHPLIADLRAAGAVGTHASAFYAFGLHFNPELPDLGADTIVAYIRGFAVAFDWLQRVSRIDLARRIFPYVQPYGRDYVQRVCDPDYAPTTIELIDDYLAANASRNRALDLLPLFARLDRARVAAAIDDPRISPRPALHYRLPNCEIEQAGWDLRPSWARWLVVENLAADRESLLALCAEYRAALAAPKGDGGEPWAERFERWRKTADFLTAS